jgi:hypothetical protein
MHSPPWVSRVTSGLAATLGLAAGGDDGSAEVPGDEAAPEQAAMMKTRIAATATKVRRGAK